MLAFLLFWNRWRGFALALDGYFFLANAGLLFQQLQLQIA
jgi:hypothetical protein